MDMFILLLMTIFIFSLYIIILVDMRKGLLIGVIFTSFISVALPWHVIPIKYFSISLQVILMFLVYIYFFFHAYFKKKTLSCFNRYSIALMGIAFLMICFLY